MKIKQIKNNGFATKNPSLQATILLTSLQFNLSSVIKCAITKPPLVLQFSKKYRKGGEGMEENQEAKIKRKNWRPFMGAKERKRR